MRADALLLLLALVAAPGCARPAGAQGDAPLVIARQGSFYAGGRVVTNPGTFDPVALGPAGQTMHGDHVYVQYQIPVNARPLPMVMWPGGGAYQTWESTPDGREGFRNLFLRRGWSVYIFDQPRRGRARQSIEGVTIAPAANDQGLFVRFRLGIWPDFYPGVQFPRGAAALEQWWRQDTPVTGPGGVAPRGAQRDVIIDAVAAMMGKVGPSVLLTHSASSILGWYARMRSDHIKAIVALEDTNFVFPEGAAPPPMKSSGETVTPNVVSSEEFAALTTIPILLVYGDNIPRTPSKYPGPDLFRVRREMAGLMVRALNARGGRAELIDLPAIGITGNTHYPMQDLNNVAVADVISKWLATAMP